MASPIEKFKFNYGDFYLALKHVQDEYESHASKDKVKSLLDSFMTHISAYYGEREPNTKLRSLLIDCLNGQSTWKIIPAEFEYYVDCNRQTPIPIRCLVFRSNEAYRICDINGMLLYTYYYIPPIFKDKFTADLFACISKAFKKYLKDI